MHKLLFITLGTLVLLSCSKSGDSVAGGVETGNGFTVGVVYTSKGDTAKESVVALVPESFNPVTDTLTDSLTDSTGAEGTFEIEAKPGVYNLYATSESEVVLLRKVTIAKGETFKKDVTLLSARDYEFRLPEVSTSAGDYYFKGTLYTAEYAEGDTSATFRMLPEGTALPALHRFEDGVDSVVTEEFVFAEVVNKPDGMYGLQTFQYDRNEHHFWVGSSSGRLYTYDLNAVLSKEYTSTEYPELNNVTHIEMGNAFNPVIASNSGLFIFNWLNETFDTLYQAPWKKTKALDVYDESNWSALIGDSLITADTSVEILNVAKADIQKGILYAVLTTGSVVSYSLYDGELQETGVTVSEAAAVHLCKDYSFWVANNEGITVIRNNTEEKYIDLPGIDVIKIYDDLAGNVWVLGAEAELFRISSDYSVIRIGDFTLELPKGNPAGNVPYFYPVDITEDDSGNIWLLVSAGGTLVKVAPF